MRKGILTFSPFALYALYSSIFTHALGSLSLPLVALGSYYSFRTVDKNVVKSLSYDNSSEKFEIVLSDIVPRKVIFKRGDYSIERRINHYLLKGLKDTFVLPTNEEGVAIDHRLLNQLLSPKFEDKALESILIRDSKLVNLACPFSRLPGNSLDLIAREKIVSQEHSFDKLTQAEINIKILSVPDTQVKDYINSLSSHIDVLPSNELRQVEEVFIKSGLEGKAAEITKFIHKNFFVTKIRHLKGLVGFELKELAEEFKLSVDEVNHLKDEFLLIK